MLIPHGLDKEMIGAYRIQQVLGRGRLSTLYLAVHPQSLQKVALTSFTGSKQLDATAHNHFLANFLQVVTSLSTLQHPNILLIDDYGEQSGDPYIVLPAVIAETLQEQLKQNKRWNPITVLPLLRQIAEALDYAHGRGIAHGGLKPANILLYSDNTVQITGFGLERILAKSSTGEQEDESWSSIMSITGTMLGELAYMAPECVQGQAATPLADVYGLGCLAYAFLHGTSFIKGTPFEILSQQLHNPMPTFATLKPRLKAEVCARLDPVLHKCVQGQPERRYQRAGDFVEAFANAIAPFMDRQDIYMEREARDQYEFDDNQRPSEDMIIDAQTNRLTFYE